MKKLKLDSEEVVKHIVNFALREYDASYESVSKKPVINGVQWYSYYWDNKESKEVFLKWVKLFLKQKVDYKPYNLDNVVSMIDLCYGLKVYDEE